MTTFTATINGVDYNFDCYTTDTRNGFCHHCISNGEHSRISYYNRTWESFRYETVLRHAIEKYPKKMREELTAQLITHTSKAEKEKAEKQLDDFKAQYDQLTPENKERLANSGIEINSAEQADGVISMMKMMNAFSALGIN